MSQPDTKPKRGPKITSQVVRSLKAAADLLKCTTRTLQNYRTEGLPGFAADGTVNLALLRPAIEARLNARTGLRDSKEEKLLEEIRRLRIANDTKEGRLVERSWVAERIQRAAGEMNAFRAKSEAEHPMKFAAAAGDVAHCRTIVRGVWDDIFSAVQTLQKHFNET